MGTAPDNVEALGGSPSAPLVNDNWNHRTGSIRLDKISNRGEDTALNLRDCGDRVVIGVFDGMGGSGAERYETSDGVRTGAEIGAQAACYAVRRAMSDTAIIPADKLRDVVADALDAALRSFGGNTSALRGRLVRKFPTTVAVMEIGPVSGSNSLYTASYWAGDSRLYVFRPGGLQQLSTDHLTSPHDAMQNLVHDAELSNHAHANASFFVASHSTNETEPFIGLAVTDGVFGYLRTPMHFEWLLLETIVRSTSFEEWEWSLAERIKDYTQDDATLEYCAAGWMGFEHLRASFTQRAEAVWAQLSVIEALAADVDAAKAAVAVAVDQYEKEVAAGWEKYRTVYEARPTSEEA